MISTPRPANLLLIAALSVATPGALSACRSDASANAPTTTPPPTAPVLQPGRPGEPNASLTGNAAIGPTTTRLDPDDTRFMQDMISHHAQALRIVAVVTKLLTDPQAKAIAGRIKAAQRPEIDAMARWLTGHGQTVPPEATYPLTAPKASHHEMPGMASGQQLEALARTSGLDADRMFLSLMITHHEGALLMALEQRKHGTDDLATELSDDISVTQSAEIRHLQQMRTRIGAGS